MARKQEEAERGVGKKTGSEVGNEKTERGDGKKEQEEKDAIAEFVTRKEYAKMMEDAIGEYHAQDDLQDDGVSSQDDTPRMDRQKWISTMQ